MPNSTEGWTITRQDLTGHDPTQALPYPVKKWWRATKEEAEAWAEKVREHFEHDPNQLVRVRETEGWSVVTWNTSLPEGSKPVSYRTYPTQAKALSAKSWALTWNNANRNLRIEVVPFVSPERNPERMRRANITINAE